MGGRGSNRKNSKKGKANDSSSGSKENPSVIEESTGGSIKNNEHPPITFAYNDRIRPLLDCIDKLRHLKVMQEGIQLPTIVVVGDQSSGKSSVLESLAGISLPRAQGICTRVPLIMRLQHHEDPLPQLHLEYYDKIVATDEANIEKDIVSATNEIAGDGKGISHTPLTLIVKKNGVPDLTMVDLPGITRVPIHGQPEDIYEQISAIITEYITPEESIILNVLSASIDFTTCESTRMSQRVNKTGERTLAVVTKVDRSPEGLLENVTVDDVNIGLGYVCVRNRIGSETYEEARNNEVKLFKTHKLLSRIDKTMVGIPVLAQKLVEIQSTIISRSLPEIVKKINEKLTANVTPLLSIPHRYCFLARGVTANVAEINKLPQNLSSVAEAMAAFMRILSSAKESLTKILIRGEFEDYPHEKKMHCTARLSEMLNRYSDDLQAKSMENEDPESFLLDEIEVLAEANGIGLPNFLPRTAFLLLLHKKVNAISSMPVKFVNEVWSYVEEVLVEVLTEHSRNYPPLQSSARRAAHNLIEKMKRVSLDQVKEIAEMEKLTDYTCNPEYISTLKSLMAFEPSFMDAVRHPSRPERMNIDGFGEIQVGHLRKHLACVQEAFDMKMRMTAYWRIVMRRLVDNMALHLLFKIHNLVKEEMEKEVVDELMVPHGGGIKRMLEESPSIAGKRSKLNKSIKLLRESKEVVANMMDRIATYGD